MGVVPYYIKEQKGEVLGRDELKGDFGDVTCCLVSGCVARRGTI